MKPLLTALCGAIAAVALFAIMGLTLFDVAGRKLLSESIPGSLELTELLMVAVIFAGLPLVSMRSEHIVFDTFDHLMPRFLRRSQRRVMDGACALLLAGLAYALWIKGGQMSEYGDTTAQLKLPLGPFVHAMGVLCGVTALVHVALAIKPAQLHPPSAAEPAPADDKQASGA